MKKRTHSLYCFGASLFLMVSSPVMAGDILSVDAGTEYMSWREYDSVTNQRLLEETGFREYAALTAAIPVSTNTRLALMGRVYEGDVDYNGQLMDGTPLKSKTGYTGLQGEAGIVYKTGRLGDEDAPDFVFTGGIDSWRRDLKGDTGYIEEYQFAYIRAGAKLDPQPGGWGARGGVTVPLHVQEHVKLYNGISLEPQGKPSFYFGVGRRFVGGFELGVEYQGYRLGQSPAVMVDTNGDGIKDAYVWQPRSELDMLRFYGRFAF